MLRFGCFERLLGNMSDHHICNFGQNNMFLHGGYLELKDPMHPHFVCSFPTKYLSSILYFGEECIAKKFSCSR